MLPNIESKKFSVCLFERDDFDKPLVQPEDDAASLRVYYSLHATLAVFAWKVQCKMSQHNKTNVTETVSPLTA